MSPSVFFEGRDPSRAIVSDTVDLVFNSSSSSWVYLNSHALVLIVDGERMDFGEILHTGSVIGSGVSEFMVVSMDIRKFLKIALAKKVEGRLGFIEFEMNDAQLKASAQFAAYLSRDVVRDALRDTSSDATAARKPNDESKPDLVGKPPVQ